MGALIWKARLDRQPINLTTGCQTVTGTNWELPPSVKSDVSSFLRVCSSGTPVVRKFTYFIRILCKVWHQLACMLLRAWLLLHSTTTTTPTALSPRMFGDVGPFIFFCRKIYSELSAVRHLQRGCCGREYLLPEEWVHNEHDHWSACDWSLFVGVYVIIKFSERFIESRWKMDERNSYRGMVKIAQCLLLVLGKVICFVWKAIKCKIQFSVWNAL